MHPQRNQQSLGSMRTFEGKLLFCDPNAKQQTVMITEQLKLSLLLTRVGEK